MKKFLLPAIIIIFASVFIYIILNFHKNYGISTVDKSLKCTLNFKGLKDAIDFIADDNGNLYIAFRNKVQLIDKNGKSYDLFKDDKLQITSIEYNNGEIYFASKCEVFCYNIKEKKQKLIMDDLPNLGDYKNSYLKIKGENLYISIGAATNSGVVGSDNKWLKEETFFHDISSIELVLKGQNYGTEKTGAFASYKTKNSVGQIVSSRFPGNASIVIYNLKSASAQNFAWGIRNVTGMDFNSQGKLIAAIGGMENRGLRPVVGDYDYIYEINQNVWYGWPDYSGGDPISSPRFRVTKSGKLDFILSKHPSSTPPAPVYQHKSVGTLGSIAVDKFGDISEKDSIYFYDNKDNNICELDKSNVLSEKVKLNSHSKVTSMKFINGKLAILDSSEGCIYFLAENSSNN